MRVLYLAHDLDDSAIWRRHKMLRLGGAEVSLAGFRRGEGALPGRANVLGRTSNGRMAGRALAVLRMMVMAPRRLVDGQPPEVILARNLEMLALAVSLRRQFPHARIVYELLDVHRLLLGGQFVSRVLRAIEARLLRRTALVLISSPGFQRGYLTPFQRPVREVLLVENKPLAMTMPTQPVAPVAEGPIRIGWFGILRCAWSLAALDHLTRAAPVRYRVVLRGKPALDVVPDFHDIVASNPDLSYLGPYRWPDDLASIYADVDLAWLVDRYETGGNSDWLLPNRLYEGCLHGAVPLAPDGTEVAGRLRELGIGVIVGTPTVEAFGTALAALDRDRLAPLRDAVRALPRETWEAGPNDCRALVARLAGTYETAAAVTDSRAAKVLIVVPVLNEAAHIGAVLQGLIPFARRTGSSIVVADGGSTDGTQEVVQQMAREEPTIRLIDNPGRLQSAGINLAVRRFGDAEWLLRIDAHSAYPADYCDQLLAEAQRTGADSVVVSMKAVGAGALQRLIALAQNSRLGNGGAAHRNSARGRWVDHGHHALIRIAAFRAVGGYDESFSHNEDAELDHRLRAEGYRIWLTAETGLDYFPRNSLGGLLQQYFRFGRGRARNVLKHRAGLGPRQAAVAALGPLVLLAPLAPLQPVFALPLMAWVLVCLAGGIAIAVAGREPRAVLSGFLAGAMHLSWSVGFWVQAVAAALRQRSAA